VIPDIGALGVRNWRNMAMNREDWLKTLKKARIDTELSDVHTPVGNSEFPTENFCSVRLPAHGMTQS
jgi:hypothetical protein